MFSRKYEKEEVIVIINRGNKAATFSHALLQTGKYKDVFSLLVAKQVKVKAMDVVVLSNK